MLAAPKDVKRYLLGYVNNSGETLIIFYAMSLRYQHSPELASEQEFKEPPLYQVILLNDDFTPQDFVVDLLRQVFLMPLPQAMAVMLQVHHRGSGVCGVYTCEVAKIKVDQAQWLAQQHEHPLRCVMREVE
ncbi:MAG: ATP-dependent Clp protease adaptor ClpS [Burkholderiales bacterium]|jgi:ATP-dependent Clp protease adaptor protein ClpS|nr:ATP-dependent Clp protease adaptor ClpS [Burkholderiales bacterium]